MRCCDAKMTQINYPSEDAQPHPISREVEKSAAAFANELNIDMLCFSQTSKCAQIHVFFVQTCRTLNVFAA